MSGVVRDYLSKLQELFKDHPTQRDLYARILKDGTEFGESETDIGDKFSEFREPKNCFYNSQVIAILGDMEYWEGWYVGKKIQLPLEHGWNVKDGKVYDFTGESRYNTSEYFGIHIPTKYIALHQLKTQYAESVLFRYLMEAKS